MPQHADEVSRVQISVSGASGQVGEDEPYSRIHAENPDGLQQHVGVQHVEPSQVMGVPLKM